MYLVICNAPTDKSKAIARTLAHERLAACVNLIPGIMTYYYSQDRFCEEDEATLFIKVPKPSLEAMQARLLELHPYSVPEIIVVDPAQVNVPYTDWVYETCRVQRKEP